MQKQTEITTSEAIFGIDEQVSQQCSLINKMQSDVNDGIRDMQHCLKDLGGIAGIEKSVSSIEILLNCHFANKSKELETLRANIIAIRSWGEGWKRLAKEMSGGSIMMSEQEIKLLSELELTRTKLRHFGLALLAADHVARARGDKFGLCDSIDNVGNPYPSQWLADLLAYAEEKLDVEINEKLKNKAIDQRWSVKAQWEK